VRRVYLLESPLRRPALVWAPTLLLALLAAAVPYWLPPRYSASALVRIDADTTDDAALESRGVDVGARRLQALAERVRDRTLLRAASASLPDLAPERLADGLEVTTIASTSFEIAFVHRDPATAALVPNTIARLLVAESAAAAPAVSAALEARIEEARRLLVEKEAAFARAESPVTARGARGGAPPRSDPQVVAELLAVTDALAKARAQADRLRRPEAPPVPEPPASPASDELAAMRAQLVELRKRYTEQHPEVVALRDRIARAERRQPTPAPVEATPDPDELRVVEGEIASLERRRAELEARAARAAAAPAIPAAAPASGGDRERALAERQQARQAYEAVLAERAAAQAAAQSGGPAARVELLREAVVPDAAGSLPLPFAAAGGALLGLVLGLVWAAVAELRDHRVKGPEDLAELLPVPVLTIVPELRGSDRS